MKKNILLLILVFAWALVSCVSLQEDRAGGMDADQPLNIILFIGDGMGVTHVSAGKIDAGVLNLESFKVLGLLTTHSRNAFVTDSAAAGTAMATGHKTDNGVISLSSDNKPLKTALEYAEENGKRTGLVVSSSVTHATPAAFVAHVDDRHKANLIAEHIATSGIDVLFGGGWVFFVPMTESGNQRTDDKDMLSEMARRMKIIRSPDELSTLGHVDAVAGFFAAQHPSAVKDRKPSLAALTRKAIEILSAHKAGFFLMVEGSQIDWAGHQNDLDYLLAELADFDEAVGAGLEYAKKDLRTLILVTADHETGGFALHDGSVEEKSITQAVFTHTKHTAAMVPVFAYGPGSSAFAGIQDNTIIGQTLIRYLEKLN